MYVEDEKVGILARKKFYPASQKLRLKVLKELILKDAYKKGTFKLSSGGVSDYFFDMKQVMLTTYGLSLISEAINEIIPNDTQAIGGPVLGAIPLVSAVLVKSNFDDMKAFMVRKEPKNTGTQVLIEGGDISGLSTVIIEDVTTTGLSAMRAVNEAMKVGANVTTVISILDRLEGARHLFEENGIKFKPLFNLHDFVGEN